MAGSAAETVIGAVVLAAAGGFLVYAANTAEIGAETGGYELKAEFRRAEGLSTGGDVRIAGVKVGTVSDMRLDPATYRAVITLTLRTGIEVPEDTAAKIAATSLLGDNFVALVPGASEYMLAAGDQILYTQDSINILDLAARAVAGGTAGDTGGADGSGE
ncbi:outer membrane lipid asymmetry maintenance protein MlaD [Paralimibaculum aggregatum]|uniref:Outer membrane lipid asymmetry maintenance protein MlaD n=1 Tax=Paralimibaculum aggregatum TaxID=3036245 RepID=A0ABQ6LMP7_9RHOB|nr:outer membrane lipid asymmetry maintenance protein MlaD [Limibaculum sp. NKW23]GMG84453.1 outer membrane lipid asymmetry maintenance protein MlaD [Limibaculum sp. NKW23]